MTKYWKPLFTYQNIMWRSYFMAIKCERLDSSRKDFLQKRNWRKTTHNSLCHAVPALFK